MPGVEGGRENKLMLMGAGIFEGEEDILGLDSGDCYITL